jgi:hypothetical protein
VPLVEYCWPRMGCVNRDSDLRIVDVPEHRLLGRWKQLLIAVDLKVKIGPVVRKRSRNALSSKLIENEPLLIVVADPR